MRTHRIRGLAELLFLLAASLFPIQAAAQDVIASPRAVLQTANEEDVSVLTFSSDGKLMAVGDVDGKISLWNVESKQSVASFEMRSAVVFLGCLSGDKDLVAVDEKGNVAIFNLLKGVAGVTFQTKASPICVSLDAGKRLLAIATEDEEIALFDLTASVPLGKIDAANLTDDMLFLGFDRPGQQLVAIMRTGAVVGWSPSTMRKIREVTLQSGELHGSRSVVHSAATNRSANVFVVGLEEVALPKGGLRSGANPNDLMRQNFVIAYDWNSGIEVKRVKVPAAVDGMVMGPGNDHIAGIPDEGNEISLTDLRRGEIGGTITSTERPLVMAISEDNTTLAVGSKSGVVSVWKLQYRGDANVLTSTLPTLAGRVRSNSGTEPALKPAVPVRLAILSFESKGVSQDVADLCLSSLSNSLTNFKYITLIERKQIADLLKEQQFQSSFMADEATSAKMGKLLNADHVLVCSVGKLGTTLLFTARLLNVETGKVVSGREVICEECRDQDIFDAVKMLASTIAQ